MQFFKIIVCLLLPLLHFTSIAQTEIIVPSTGSSSVTVCDKLIYDYGGSTSGLTKSNTDGSLTIYPSTAGTMVALSLADLDIDYYSDYLYIYNGENTSAPLLATLQGAYNSTNAAKAGEFYGTNAKGAITVRLKTTYTYPQADGMILRARCTPTGELNNMARNQKRVINSCNTSIYDNGGRSGNYQNSSTDTILILPDAPDKVVQLKFEYVSINNWDGYDQLFFLGSLSTSGSSTLFLLSGYNTAGNSGTSTNPNGSASFVFESDASYVGQGFRTVVTCSTKTTTPLTENIVPITGTASMKTCSAKISDNGDKYNYFPNSNGTLTINPAQAGTKVKAVFSLFNLGAGDYLNFYDGANTSAPLIAKYTSTSTPDPINATNLSGALTVQFVSNATDEAAGFSFDVSCMTPIPITSIAVTPSPAEIDQYSTVQLSTDILPTNSTNKKVIWSSSDPTIASVTGTGLVTGLLPGSATISAQSEEYPTIKGSSTVTVKPIPLVSMTVTPSPANVQIGLTGKLTVNYQPSNASYKQVTWSSADPTIATVNASGVVTGVNFGTVTITATNSDGTITASSQVTVIPVSVTKIVVSPATATIPGNGSVQLSVTVTPANAANKQVTWTSSNTAIATVNSNGLVEAVGAGVATITAKSVDGNFTSTSKITVSPTPVSGISITENATEIYLANSVQLHVSFQPSYATNKQITWSSSDANIASVSNTGLVTGIALGSAVITATSVDGSFTATTTVTVLPVPVTGITITESNSEIFTLNTIQLHAAVTPANAANQQISWSSSNESVASVNTDGLVTGNTPSSAIITATSADGNFTATVTITVLPIAVESITITESNSVVKTGKTIPLHAVILPSDATNTKITWTSSDETIATVNENGVVTGVSNGNVLITATTVDGNYSATANVTVETVVAAGITGALSNESILIYPNPSEGTFQISFPVAIEKIEVINSVGQKETFSGTDLTITTSLKGLLIVKIYTAQESYFSKLISR